MAFPVGGSPPDLKEELLLRPDTFSFFQVVRLLRFFCGATDRLSSELFERELRVVPRLSLGFSGTDIFSLTVGQGRDAPLYELVVNFLGLYGASSPLPSHYTEELLAEVRDDSTVLRDFLNVLGMPFYRLLFQCWSKYRLAFQVIEEKRSQPLEWLYCLQGFGSEELRAATPGGTYEFLRYLGLLTQSTRSALGLQTLLADALGQVDLTIDQCVPDSAEISPEQQCHLGEQASRLGVDCLLGHSLAERMGCFRISIRGLDLAAFRSFQPGADGFVKLGRLTRLYLNQPLHYNLELSLKREMVRTVVLGEENWNSLGRESWIFSGDLLPGQAQVHFLGARTLLG